MPKAESRPKHSNTKKQNSHQKYNSWGTANQYEKEVGHRKSNVKVIISGYYRSGSTLTGALLASVTSTFYLYELSRSYYIDWLYAMTSLDSTSYSDVMSNKQHVPLVTEHVINMLNCDLAHVPVELLMNNFHFSFGAAGMKPYVGCVTNKRLIKAYTACHSIIDPFCSMSAVGENSTLLNACFRAKSKAWRHIGGEEGRRTVDRTRAATAAAAAGQGQANRGQSYDAMDHRVASNHQNPNARKEFNNDVNVRAKDNVEGVYERSYQAANQVKGEVKGEGHNLTGQGRVTSNNNQERYSEQVLTTDNENNSNQQSRYDDNVITSAPIHTRDENEAYKHPAIEGQGRVANSVDARNDVIGEYAIKNITGSIQFTGYNNSDTLDKSMFKQFDNNVDWSEGQLLRNNSPMANRQRQRVKFVIVDREINNVAAETVVTTTANSATNQDHAFQSSQHHKPIILTDIETAGHYNRNRTSRVTSNYPRLPGNASQKKRKRPPSGGQGRSQTSEEVTEKVLERAFMEHAQCLQPLLRAIQPCVPLMESQCQRAPIRLLKEVRLDLRVLPSLLAKDPNVKVIHLVRDPRGQIILGHRFNKISQLCSRMLRDLHVARMVERNYPSSIIMMRYEDLVLLPLDTARAFYDHVGVDGDLYYSAWLQETSNPVDNSGVQGTYRVDPAAEAYDWRTLMPKWVQRQVLKIRTCAHVIDELGYPRD